MEDLKSDSVHIRRTTTTKKKLAKTNSARLRAGLMFIGALITALAAYGASVYATNNARAPPFELPPQTFAVIGGTNVTYRDSSFDTFFNPTSTAAPFFQVFDRAFLSILGHKPSIREVASNSTFAFAHEAPIYVAATNEVFFASNDGGPLGMSDLEHNSVVGKISLNDVDTAVAANVGIINVPVTFVSPR
ncbi:hypothetical protein H0H87_010849 [Tephrocybe sp. NHM501043]|nr:hypothetical protein H0H87_010849 [Tephrocybe sp. NHM501043]